MKNIPQNIFTQLIERAVCDTGEDTSLIGLRSKIGNYELSFYAEDQDDYLLIVEDFGKMIKGKWEQFVPTKNQKLIMRKKITDKADALYAAAKTEIITEPDNYDTLGLNIGMFL